MLSPNCCFTLFAAGMVLVYVELLRPGLYVAGCLGTASLSAAVFYFSHYALAPFALGLIGVSVLLFIIESIWESNYLAGGIGTAIICLASTWLVAPPNTIAPILAIPVCLCVGAASTYLARQTRLARQNKTVDI